MISKLHQPQVHASWKQSTRALVASSARLQRASTPAVRNRQSCICQAEAASGDDSMQPHVQQPPAGGVSSSTGNGGVLQTDPVQLSELLTRLSELQVKPHQQWLQGVLDTMQPRLQELSNDQLSATLKVLGGWGLMPAEPFMQAMHTAVTRQASSLTMRHIADMAWGLAQLQYPRQPFLDELLQAALDLLSSQHCRASAISAQQYGGHSAVPQTHNECLLQQHVQPQAPVCCSGSLADLIWSVARLQHTPSHAWLSTFAGTSQAIMTTFTPHELAQVIWAFARLPYQPGQLWMDNFLEVVRIKLRDFDSKSVSLTAWGLATMKVQPSMRWLFAFERQAERTLSTLAASELACTLWALSELKEKRADKLRLGRLVRRQEVFWGFDYEALSNPRLLKVVRQLTLGPQASKG